MDLCELEASLIYRISSRTGRTTQKNRLEKPTNKQQIDYSCIGAEMKGNSRCLDAKNAVGSAAWNRKALSRFYTALGNL